MSAFVQKYVSIPLANIELVNFESRVVVHFVRKMPKLSANTDISVLVKTNFIKQIAFF